MNERQLSGHEMYVMARDEGWRFEFTERMKGTSIHVWHPVTGLFAGAFGYGGDDAAWEALARTWNAQTNEQPFWAPEPD